MMYANMPLLTISLIISYATKMIYLFKISKKTDKNVIDLRFGARVFEVPGLRMYHSLCAGYITPSLVWTQNVFINHFVSKILSHSFKI